jgi:hypothetical protein
VSENLPVVVPASQATAGLGRLYRRGGSRGHAAAALRAGTVARLGPGVGLAPTDQPAIVAARLAEATGRTVDEVAALLYGPVPNTDRDLLDLAQRLDALEKETSA